MSDPVTRQSEDRGRESSEIIEEGNSAHERNPVIKTLEIDEDAIERVEEEITKIEEDVDQYIKQFTHEHGRTVQRKIAAQVVDEECETPPARRVLWVDETEPYFLCVDCFRSHRDQAWTGDGRHPNFAEFQLLIHNRLRKEYPCEYCRETKITQIELIIANSESIVGGDK